MAFDWRTSLLQSYLGAPVTPQNLRFLSSWQRWEGGHTANDARWNWLNTTRNAPGVTGSINSVGVKAFDTPEHGLAATAATLRSNYYKDIVSGLMSGNPYASVPSRGLSTWVGGPNAGINAGYVNKIMGTNIKGSEQGGPALAPGPIYPQSPVQQPLYTRRPPPINPLALMGAAQMPDARSQTMSLLGAILSRAQAPPAPRSSRGGPALAPAAAPAMSGPAFSGVGGGLLQRAVGGAKYTDLGGPSAHQARPLGNWQSDNAYDLGLPIGTPIYAVADGVIGPKIGVQKSRPKDGARLTLMGQGNQWWYGHLSRLAVRAGQRVRAGQLLGYSGASQNGAAHLHLGVMH